MCSRAAASDSVYSTGSGGVFGLGSTLVGVVVTTGRILTRGAKVSYE